MVQDRKPPDYIKELPVMYFIDHTHYESGAPGTYSKRNEYEAKEIVKAVQYLCDQGVPPSKITVLCSYRGQVGRTSVSLYTCVAYHEIRIKHKCYHPMSREASKWSMSSAMHVLTCLQR